MKQLYSILLIVGMVFVCFGGYAVALPNPDPTTYGDDDGTEFFSTTDGFISVELFDPIGGLPGAISVFGFFFKDSPQNSIPIFGPSDQSPSGTSPQVAMIDFNQGLVYDYDSGEVQNTFAGSGDIGFFLLLDLPDPDPLPEPYLIISTAAALNPGGLDLASTFPLLSDPMSYLLTFELNGGPVAVEMLMGVTPSAQAIPEASSIMLVALGLLGLGVLQHRKKIGR